MADLTGKVKALIDSVRGKLTNPPADGSGKGPLQRLGYRNTRIDHSVHDGQGNYEVASLPGKRAPK